MEKGVDDVEMQGQSVRTVGGGGGEDLEKETAEPEVRTDNLEVAAAERSMDQHCVAREHATRQTAVVAKGYHMAEDNRLLHLLAEYMDYSHREGGEVEVLHWLENGADGADVPAPVEANAIPVESHNHN